MRNRQNEIKYCKEEEDDKYAVKNRTSIFFYEKSSTYMLDLTIKYFLRKRKRRTSRIPVVISRR